MYNAFAGTQLAFTPLIGSGNRGVYPGNFITGSSKHLVRWQALNANTGANTTSPDLVYLCDYVGFYPLVDCDSVDLQEMDNTQTLPRYTTGEGVRAVLIVQAPMLATAALTITYTNQAGVSGRTVTANVIPGLSIGVCATAVGTGGAANNATPFFPLAAGDTGIRQIDSVQFAGSAGGFICIALVETLANIQLIEVNVPVEKTYAIETQMPPEVLPGAYLNFLIQRSGTGAGSLRCEMLFANS